MAMIITSFRVFLGSTIGGCWSDKSIKNDLSNVISIFNAVSVENLFNPLKLDEFITEELKLGKSPSTLHSKLQSFLRFINFIKIFKPNPFPTTDFCPLLAMMKGMDKTLTRLKCKRQQQIMLKNRESYPHTTAMLRDWRSKRNIDNPLTLFDEFDVLPDKQLTQEIYTMLRNYLIVELIIPNAQRPGIIQGVTIDEAVRAKDDITCEGYHRLMVSSHKTGYVQSATIFIYKEVYHALKIFIERILVKIPSKNAINNKSRIFVTYKGRPIESSQVTPIIRDYLQTMGLSFKGTISDIRKAAATLTGKHDPNLHELMAQFLCHSRKAHDRYYRVQLGHQGLTHAFSSLEKFQSHPNSVLSVNNSTFSLSPTHSFIQNTSNINTSNLECDPHNFDDSNSNPTLPIDSSQIGQVSLSPKLSNIIQFNSNIPNSLEIPIKSCRINLNPDLKSVSNTDMVSLWRRFNKFKVSSSRQSSYGKNLFSCKKDENNFLKTFSFYINNVKMRREVTKRDILALAHSSLEFAPLLLKLQTIFSVDDINRRIIDKVRGHGYRRRVSNKLPPIEQIKDHDKNLFSNLSDKSFEQIVHRPHRKAVFSIKKDELIFRNIFRDLILRVTQHHSVSRMDILDRCSHQKFLEVMDRLKIKYPYDAHIKLVNMVRSIGYAKRR